MLTLETGEGLADSDSLVTLEEVRAFAVSRGYAVPEDDTTLEQQVRLAHDILVANEEKFQGVRRVAGQALPFPRNGVWLYGREVLTGIIPQTLKWALCQLVVEIQTVDLMPTADGAVVVEETIGPITTKFADNGARVNLPSMPRVDAYLQPLFTGGGGFGLRAVRI